MQPEAVKLVQDSFQLAAPISDQVADEFYDRLFQIAPEVRPLFPADLGEQKKKLMQMLGTAVNGLSRLDMIRPTVQELGRRHVSYGVKDAHYEAVGAALLATLESKLGEAWTPELKQAWTEAYTILAKVMKEAAAETAPS